MQACRFRKDYSIISSIFYHTMPWPYFNAGCPASTVCAASMYLPCYTNAALEDIKRNTRHNTPPPWRRCHKPWQTIACSDDIFFFHLSVNFLCWSALECWIVACMGSALVLLCKTVFFCHSSRPSLSAPFYTSFFSRFPHILVLGIVIVACSPFTLWTSIYNDNFPLTEPFVSQAMVLAASAVADAIGGAQVPGLFDQDLWLLAASLRGNWCQQKRGAFAGHLFASDGADGVES